jgi:hypothetical protein
MRIELDERERELLLDLLEEQLGDLRDEIYRAESHEFKELLRAKKELVKKLIEHLRVAAAPVGAG